jgi:tRNA threonylcarbamoyl adenosine modification protein YeaZ
MMNVVAIETTGTHLGLALYDVDVVKKTMHRRGVTISHEPLKQALLLFPLLTQLLKKARVAKNKIGLIVVDVGPGSFTGVRIGVATARALGQALRLPVIGVSSLNAIARQKKGAAVVPWLPALAGEVYYQTGKEPKWGTQAEFDAAVRKLNKQHKRIDLATGVPQVTDVAEIGIDLFLKRPNAKAFSYSRVSPLYLQPSWAERKNPR